ncbi:MAG: Flp family type IVb pilin [Pseudomonadota bacterium]
MRNLISIFKDQNGATAIEYGLIAALISIAAIAAIRNVGTGLNGTFTNVAGNLGR